MKVVALLFVAIAAVLLTPSEAFFGPMMQNPFGMMYMMNSDNALRNMFMLNAMNPQSGAAGGASPGGFMQNPFGMMYLMNAF